MAEKDCTEVGLAEKSKAAAGAEVKNNTVKCGINLFEEAESMFSAKKLPLMYEKEVFVPGLFLRSRFYFLSVLYFTKVFMISRGM